MKPITPKEVMENATKPDEVFEAFNELIQKYWDGSESKFEMKEVASLIAKKLSCGAKVVSENRYLDVEHIYTKYGWDVVFDKAGYNESYPSTYTFRRRS